MTDQLFKKADHEFSKDFFQEAWGKDGYYEHFNYGVGIEKVIELSLAPFLSMDRQVLEIGSGGGVFTENIQGRVKHLTAIDVIKMPARFSQFQNFSFIELPDKDYVCTGVDSDRYDFAFSYNVFCHLPNIALYTYINEGIHRVLKTGADLVFMLANFEYTSIHFQEQAGDYKREQNRLTPVGHFHQDKLTVFDITDPEKWEIVNLDIIKEHRDIIVHLRKK